MTAVKFQNVSFSYEKAPILNGASFSINEGELVALIGPNGGGKTTALKLILGFLSPKCGQVEVLNSSPKRARTRMGYVPQINAYDKAFPISVLEVVLSGVVSKVRWFGTIPKEEKVKAMKLLEQLGLEGLSERPFGSISGGQAQKTLIARALISDPNLLLLDEPTANVDAESEEAIFSFLSSLQGKKSVLIVTHNFDAIMKHTKRVLCFQKEVASIESHAVCEHFSLGMYHQPKGSKE